MKRVVLAALLVAAAGVLGFGAPAHAAGAQVHAASNTFNDGSGCATSPGEITTVAVDQPVTWHNCDGVDHTITSNDNGATFDQPLPHGQPDVSITFHEPGSYPYYCKIHGHSMKGTIDVTGVSASSSSSTTQATTPSTERQTTTTKQSTTSTSTTVPTTTTSTTSDLGGVFDPTDTSVEPTTTIFSTGTTRALGQSDDNGTGAGTVAALVLGLGAIGTAAALVIRRMRGGAITPP